MDIISQTTSIELLMCNYKIFVSDDCLHLISELIQKTNSDDLISSIDELIDIAKFIKSIDINDVNIHSILKLISNLMKFTYVCESQNDIFYFDIKSIVSKVWPHNRLNFDAQKHIKTHNSNTTDSDSDLSYSSSISDMVDEEYTINESEKKNKLIINDINDGDIVSIINIYCSPKYNMYREAIDLISEFDVHKTSSYTPIFKYLVNMKMYNEVKQFYTEFLEINKIIEKNNNKIKEINVKIRQYNEKIKLLKKKNNETCLIIDEIIDIGINKFVMTEFKADQEKLFNIQINELPIKHEKKIIECSPQIIKEIMIMAIENNDQDFMEVLMLNINDINIDFLSVIIAYFKKFNIEYTMSNLESNTCLCCNKYISNNVIKTSDRQSIMSKIKNKILKITHRHDNGVAITQNEKQIITDKWNDFEHILKINKFDIVIDGANIGYVNSKGSSDINVKFIQTTIQNIISKTSKKVLLIMHQRHTSKIKTMNFDRKTSANLVIYTTPNNINDDWFWLYASLYNKCRILTNDQSRDHAYNVSYQNEIKKWFANYQVKIDPNNLSYVKEILSNKEYCVSSGIFFDNNTLHVIYKNNLSFGCICADYNEFC
jgi:hypothetical protein